MLSCGAPAREQEAWEAAGLRRIAVDSEAWREYVYTDGFTYRVNHPIRLYIKSGEKGDSHRVVDCVGVTHYIPAGWRIVRWDATPEVEF